MAFDLDEQLYFNLVCVFYSNMEIFANRLNRMITHVGSVSIEFDVEDLNNILGILNAGHEIYTSRKVFLFVDFAHNSGVRNICWRQDITSDVCAFPFRLQLLSLQVRILYTILQHF